MTHEDTERELKPRPADPGLLGCLAAVDRLGPFRVTRRRLERQHNAFFDTPTGALRAARLGFRRRTLDGQSLATWTLKGPALLEWGIASRDGPVTAGARRRRAGRRGQGAGARARPTRPVAGSRPRMARSAAVPSWSSARAAQRLTQAGCQRFQGAADAKGPPGALLGE